MNERPGRRSPLLRSAALAVASLLVSFGLAEGIARVAGREPFGPPEQQIQVEPGGRYQRMHEKLGFQHLPGRYQITFPDGWSWTATHREDTLRVTRPLEEYDEPLSDRQIWVFGCSFTHGWGLNDEQTFPWQLQVLTRSEGFEVVNFGTGGYGTLQSLVQFEEALTTRPPPEVAILAYAGFHDQRNTMLRSWQKANFSYWRFGPTIAPYARLNRDGGLEFGFSGGIAGLDALRYSAFLHVIEQAYNRFEASWLRSHAVSRRLVDLFAEKAEEVGTEFIVVGISQGKQTTKMVQFARKRGITARDISIREEGYTIPFDGHPNARAGREFARRLYGLLAGEGLLEAGSEP